MIFGASNQNRILALRRLFVFREIYRVIVSPLGDAYGYGEYDKYRNKFEYLLTEDEVLEFNRVVILEKSEKVRPAGYDDETPDLENLY